MLLVNYPRIRMVKPIDPRLYRVRALPPCPRGDAMRMPVAIAVLVSLVLSLAGCGADDTSASSGGAPSGSSSSSAPTEPSTSAEPEAQVQEARGPRLRVPEAELRLPDGDWTVVTQDKGLQSGGILDGSGYIVISSFPVISTQPDLDLYADLAVKEFRGREGVSMKRGEDLEIAGVEGRTFVGTSVRGPYFAYLGIVGTTEASSVQVRIETAGSTRAHERVVDTVMASFEWR